MSKEVSVVHLMDDRGRTVPSVQSSVIYEDYESLVRQFKKGTAGTLLAGTPNRTYRVTFKDGSTELWRNKEGDPRYVYTKVEETPMTDEGMSYKDALEWMTLNAKKPLYDKDGNEFQIHCCTLQYNGDEVSDPFEVNKFKSLRLYKTKPQPKPVFIPFWDAVKAAGQDGKCIRKYENKGTGIQATYRFKSDYPTEWQFWDGSVGKWRNTNFLFNHVVDVNTYWAIVEDPSNRN